METAMMVHELRLGNTSQFAKEFNYVGEMYSKSQDDSLTETERAKAFDAYWSAKYCLEQGIRVI